MNRFKSALRTAAMYTLAYFFIFTGAFWLTFFVLVTLQAFWKIFASFFVIALAICTFDAFGGVDRVRKIWSDWQHARRFRRGIKHSCTIYGVKA